MPITMHTASVPLFRQMLTALRGVLDKGEAHARARGLDPDELLQTRLAPDMFPLVRQVQIAADFAKGVSARLAGAAVPSHPDTETTFDQLRARIDTTVEFISGLDAAAFAGSETREIVLRPGTDKEKRFNGHDYLIHYALPHFFFHVTTAYALLRHHGAEIGKRDYMGG